MQMIIAAKDGKSVFFLNKKRRFNENSGKNGETKAVKDKPERTKEKGNGQKGQK